MLKVFRGVLPRVLLYLAIALALYIPAKYTLLQAQPPADVVIGSKNFTESRILAEMYAQALEKAGYSVRRRFDLGGTLIAHAALRAGEIDLYPEYTGTGFMTVLKIPPKNDNTDFPTLQREYHQRWALRWLKPAEANNSQGLVVRRNTAEQYHLYTISRLVELAPHLRLAAIPEFVDREDGLKGLRKRYGALHFQQIRQYDNSLKYRVLLNDNADVAVGFTTDGELTDSRLTLLRDDRGFWPQYRVAPVLREKLLNAHPLMAGILNRVSAQIDTSALRMLNAEVDIQKKDYRDVACTFLKNRRIL